MRIRNALETLASKTLEVLDRRSVGIIWLACAIDLVLMAITLKIAGDLQ